MKILILSRGIPSKNHPQLGCFELDQAKTLTKAGHKVIMIAVDGAIGKRWKKIGISEYNIDGIKCYEFFGVPTILIRKFLSQKKGLDLEFIFWKRLFKRALKIENVDLIHAHYLFQIYQGTKLKKISGLPLVATEHFSSVTQTPIRKDILDLAQITYPKVDSIIAVSENLKNKIKEYTGKNSTVIHNLIDTSFLHPALDKKNSDPFTIIAVGTLCYRKGFDILIKAFKQSFLKNKNVKVKIFGNGPEYSNLNNLIKENKLEDKVILMGQKTKDIIFNELHNSDLFVLSSRQENFSVALIEATANGVPAIATLCGGVEEYPVSNVTKIPIEDVIALKNALEEAYDNRNNVDREKIQQETLQHFSPEVIVEQIEEVYNKTLKTQKTNKI